MLLSRFVGYTSFSATSGSLALSRVAINNNFQPRCSKLTLPSRKPTFVRYLSNGVKSPTTVPLRDRIQPYIQLMRLDKPIGTWLLLWPCYWSITMGTTIGHFPDPKLLALFGIGAVVMRGAGCTINDLADRDIDNKVARTVDRPITSGKVSVKQAIAFLGGQLSAGLAVLLSLNNYSIVLGASSLFLVVVYPFMKRITYWPQIVLGLAFNWGTLLGYSAAKGFCDWSVTIPLYIAGISWTLVYDTIYAHQDKEDDRLIGVKSTALRFGEKSKQWLSGFAGLTVGCLAFSGIMADRSWPFFVGTALGGLHLAWQIGTVDFNNRQDCFNKFVSNKWFGAIVCGGILASNFVS